MVGTCVPVRGPVQTAGGRAAGGEGALTVPLFIIGTCVPVRGSVQTAGGGETGGEGARPRALL
jgi:hypothetical protein